MMTETNKVLIEQTLFGINDQPLQGEDYLLEALSQYIDNPHPGYTMLGVLNESIEFSSQFSKYTVLLEAADEVKAAEQAIAETNEENEDPDEKMSLCQKMLAACKKAITWWYKVDPETKAMTCRIIAKLVFNIAISVLRMFVSWKLTGKIPFSSTINFVKGVPAKIKGIPDWISKIPERFKKLFSKKTKTDVNTPEGASKFKDWLKGIFNKRNLLLIGINTLISAFVSGMEKLDHELYYRINLTDLEENIKKYDKLVDDFNDMIDETDDPETLENLKKGKAAAESALRQLLYIKEEKKVRDAKAKEKEEKKALKEQEKETKESNTKTAGALA